MKIKRSMKKIVFILLIFCSFLVVWGCNKNKTKCVPQKEATSDSSMRSNDDTLSLMIEHDDIFSLLMKIMIIASLAIIGVCQKAVATWRFSLMLSKFYDGIDILGHRIRRR